MACFPFVHCMVWCEGVPQAVAQLCCLVTVTLQQGRGRCSAEEEGVRGASGGGEWLCCLQVDICLSAPPRQFGLLPAPTELFLVFPPPGFLPFSPMCHPGVVFCSLCPGPSSASPRMPSVTQGPQSSSRNIVLRLTLSRHMPTFCRANAFSFSTLQPPKQGSASSGSHHGAVMSRDDDDFDDKETEEKGPVKKFADATVYICNVS
ncbi:PREDICTED: uncharacterized protein LOC106149829 isoform X1 [Chinchilla lanigera]|uniref:uncharacterized protein LOC106149829 isoform X1 n=1 Tax=Chinchilla lanigera TaxID=34839 RepID=UPI000697D7E8|nr:PREDICTED: uncharacterized protein LOC106149829 isoform X1 [Chinchilla lanigera]